MPSLPIKPLFYKKNGKSYKSYDIAHIYPLKPTQAEIDFAQERRAAW